MPAQEKARSHGYYWPYRQWGIVIATTSPQMITLPLSATILRGITCDGGDWHNSIGINGEGNIYSAATSEMKLGVGFIVICK